ncbi:MAG: helix-turn-helix transcriptional regulator [Gemmatimonadales bacterium]
MTHDHGPDPVFVGLRAFMAPVKGSAPPAERPPSKPKGRRAKGWPDLVLLIDTETTVDAIQRLRFGSYRLCRWALGGEPGPRAECIEEGLFHDDDLAPAEVRELQDYVRDHQADTTLLAGSPLALYSRREFLDHVLWPAVRDGLTLVCGFNLPFDLSRLAIGWGETRPRGEARYFARGFSFPLWDWFNPKTGEREEHPYRPRLLIRHHDSKRARFGWARCLNKIVGKGPKGARSKRIPSLFLDLRTLAFALTDQSHSLASAAKTFRTPHQKTEGDHAARLTATYIDYNRQDLRVTQELLEALRAELDLHELDVDPWQVQSPASLAKACLRKMGITPVGTRAQAVPDWVHGAAMEGYYGGRTECHIIRTSVPVVYTDFLSMYPSVQSLAQLEKWLTAGSLHPVACTAVARRTLAGVTLNTCLDPSLWPQLRFLARVVPHDDILPVRAQYATGSDNFGIGVNRLTSREPIWYSGFDLAASVLLTGRVPRILKAVTLEARGTAPTLRAVKLRGQVPLDPRVGDVFRTLGEARAEIKRDNSLPEEEQKRLRGLLKVIANSGGYGILAEMNPQDLREGTTLPVQVIGGSSRFTVESPRPEQAGEYLFPPMASLVTGAARLLLALLEALVREQGGTYAMCDTDSMAIVAAEAGGFVACPGGPERGPAGEPGVKTLSWAQVRAIVHRLDALKPYGPAVPESLLKVEDANFRDGQQIQLHCFGISAKRYCLFVEGPDGPEIVKASEHGLGHLLNPTDPEETERGPSGVPAWIEAVWRHQILAARGQKAPPLPSWTSRPAVARHGFTSPALLRPLHQGQRDRAYGDQVKPFNFALTGYVVAGGEPAGANASSCHLIAPFERDARRWEAQPWHDTHSMVSCYITTSPTTSNHVARVKSVADVIRDHGAHPESKSAAPGGARVTGRTVGLLERRHVTPLYFFRLGKESNKLEAVLRGEIQALEEVQEIHENPGATAWEAVWLPMLQTVSAQELAEATGISGSLIHRYRKGRVRPRRQTLKLLIGMLSGETRVTDAVATRLRSLG